MKPFATSIIFGAVGGVAIAALTIWLGVPPIYLFAGGLLFVVTWPAICVRFYAPRQIHRQMRKALDPTWEPPATAQPATHPVLTRMSEVAASGDWDALRGHLSEDFTLVDLKGRRFGSKLYVRAMKQFPRIYPDFRSQDELVLADPAQPDVFYVRQLQAGRPRSGPALDITMWARVELAPCGERVRRIGADAVVRAA